MEFFAHGPSSRRILDWRQIIPSTLNSAILSPISWVRKALDPLRRATWESLAPTQSHKAINLNPQALIRNPIPKP